MYFLWCPWQRESSKKGRIIRTGHWKQSANRACKLDHSSRLALSRLWLMHHMVLLYLKDLNDKSRSVLVLDQQTEKVCLSYFLSQNSTVSKHDRTPHTWFEWSKKPLLFRRHTFLTDASIITYADCRWFYWASWARRLLYNFLWFMLPHICFISSPFVYLLIIW